MKVIVNSISTGVLCVLFTGLCICVTCLGLFFFRKLQVREGLKMNHDVTAVIYGVITLIYSLILAFVIVAVWQDYEEINTDITKEADKLRGIINHAEELPDSIGVPIRESVTDYVKLVAGNGWHSMQSGKTDRESINAITNIIRITFNAQVQSQRELNILRVIHDDVGDVSDLRVDRLTHTHSHVPTLVWLVLITGSIISVIYSYFFFVDSARHQYIITSFLATMIAMSLFLVYMLDHPFYGSSSISQQPFIDVLEGIQ